MFTHVLRAADSAIKREIGGVLRFISALLFYMGLLYYCF